MTDIILLEQKIEKSGFKLNYIAKRLGITYQSLHLKLQNKRPFTMYEVQMMCDLLDVSSLEEKERIFFAQKVDYKST